MTDSSTNEKNSGLLPKNRKFWLVLTITIWVAFFVLMGIVAYVNYGLPHGPSYPTGDYECQNDERGPCGEVYKEDLRNVPIPKWAKYLRENWELYWIGLFVVGAAASGKLSKTSADT